MDIFEKRQRLNEIDKEAAKLWKEIDEEVQQCQHEWGETFPDPRTHMKRWGRNCPKCGHREWTSRSTEEGPDFGD